MAVSKATANQGLPGELPPSDSSEEDSSAEEEDSKVSTKCSCVVRDLCCCYRLHVCTCT